MKKIGAAIIGCGAIHHKHMEAITSLPDAYLAAIVSPDKKKAEHLSELYNCKYYLSSAEMLNDPEIDVVHVCTPHFMHKGNIIEALLSDKHVFSEKPVALNTNQVDEIKSVLATTGKKLAVCYQNRLNNTSVKIKNIIDNKDIGNLLSVKAILTWYRDEDYYLKSQWRGDYRTEGGSLLINQAIHTLDLIQWFCGEIQCVKGTVDNVFLTGTTNTEDSAMVNIISKSGVRCIFYATNGYTINSPLQLELNFEQGSLRLIDNELWFFKQGEKQLIASDSVNHNAQKNYWGNSHKDMIERFYHAINADDSLCYVDIAEAEKSLAIVEAIYHSSQVREWVYMDC